MRRHTAAAPQSHRNALLRPAHKTWRQKVKSFLWDRENKTCFTRTPFNWLTITTYYIIFLILVILIFYVSMKISESVSSNHDRPQYILDDSPIGSSPTLNFFPLKDSRNLIWLSGANSFSEYVDLINKEFEMYKKANKKFDPSQFGSCAAAPFGYDSKTPCIFFRLNRLILWKPTAYKQEDEFPDDMPKEVKDLISSSDVGQVWFSCNGTTAKDRDHMSQDFFDFPGSKGFNVSVYPFDRQNDYLDPIVALQLKDSKQQKVLYSFTCTAWSKGLDAAKTKVDISYYFE